MMLAFFLWIFLFPARVQAQQAVAFDSVQISLWPEFDRPDLLVFYDLTLSSQTSLPANLQIRIPRSAGEPHALAMRGADGGLTTLSYETRIAGERVWVSFTTPALEVRLEYYDPIIWRDGQKHGFTYTWPGDYLVRSLKIQVQQPSSAGRLEAKIERVSSSGETGEPMDMGIGRTGSDNLAYHGVMIGEVAAGSAVRVTTSYSKTDDQLSFNSLPVQPSQPITPATSGRTNLTGLVPWVLGAIGFLLIAAGVFWYWQSGAESTPDQVRHRANRRGHSEEKNNPAENYCPKCGKQVSPNDNFCRVCGAKLASE